MVLVDPSKTLYRKEAGKKAGCSDGKGRRYEKGGIVAIVEGEAHGGLGLRGGLLGKDEGFAGTARINCLVKEQKKEYQTGWKIKTGNVLDSCNQRSTQQCTKSGVAKHLGVAVIQQQNGLVKETNVTLLAKVRCFLIQSGLSKVFWAEDTTMSTYLVNRSPSSAIGFKTPIDMLGIFGWLASIKQGMLEPVKVKCIFLGYRKGIVGTGSMQVLQGDKFEVEPQDGHTFEVEPHENVGHVVGSKKYKFRI
ncbi:zinc finger, CCHC-type containing protein [Tanacetum coccineum]